MLHEAPWPYLVPFCFIGCSESQRMRAAVGSEGEQQGGHDVAASRETSYHLLRNFVFGCWGHCGCDGWTRTEGTHLHMWNVEGVIHIYVCMYDPSSDFKVPVCRYIPYVHTYVYFHPLLTFECNQRLGIRSYANGRRAHIRTFTECRSDES